MGDLEKAFLQLTLEEKDRNDGGFNLRKFRSNNEFLLREIADGQVQQFHKVLGVSWDLKSD